MQAFTAEIIGTAILILLGNGVVANAVLNRSKALDGGWLLISAGWGMAVFVAVLCTKDISGAHLNPAVTIGLATAGEFPWHVVPTYVAAQLIGGGLGGALVYVYFRPHYAVTSDADAKLATFCTAPAIRDYGANLLCEVIATFMLVFPVLYIVEPQLNYDTAHGGTAVGLGTLGALPVGLIVFAIGMSLGGTTGYAINPARDLGPRIAHALLPIPGKRDADWSYAWVPIVGPLLGGVLAALAGTAMLS